MEPIAGEMMAQYCNVIKGRGSEGSSSSGSSGSSSSSSSTSLGKRRQQHSRTLTEQQKALCAHRSDYGTAAAPRSDKHITNGQDAIMLWDKCCCSTRFLGFATNCIAKLAFKLDEEEDGTSLATICRSVEKCRLATRSMSAVELKRQAAAFFDFYTTDNGHAFNNHFTIPIDGCGDRVVCRRSFEYVYGLGAGSLDNAALEKRQFILSGGPSGPLVGDTASFRISRRELKETYNDLSLEEVGEVLAKIKPRLDTTQIKAFSKLIYTPLKDYHAQVWVEEYAEQFADCAPNDVNQSMYLSEGFMQDVYNDKYRLDCIDSTIDPISLKDFTEMWTKIMPEVILTRYHCQMGKCETCGHLERIGKSCNSKAMRIAAKALHAYHRTYYGGARKSFMKRCEFARDHPDECLCVDVDIAEQGIFRFPWSGFQHQQKDAISSQFLGVLEINRGVSFFHFYDSVPKGANLVIHCVLTVLDAWVRRHGKFPKYLFLNVDGGGENANQHVLAFLEFLVAKRIVTKEALFSRNPPGHTHGPIDGRFSNLKKIIINESIPTLDALKKIVEEDGRLLGTTKLHFVDVIADYKSFFNPFLGKLDRLHKTTWTQLQWRFLAVEESPAFPHGVQVMYRAHPEACAIELKIVEPGYAVSDEARLTGLEPTTTYYEWKPKAGSDVEMGSAALRTVDGIYLLKGIPFGPLVAFNIAKDTTACLDKAILAIAKSHGHTSQTYEWWSHWRQNDAPPSENVNDWLQSHILPTFFRDFFSSLDLKNDCVIAAAASRETQTYPTEVIALATNSVITQFSRSGINIPARLILYRNPLLAGIHLYPPLILVRVTSSDPTTSHHTPHRMS